MRLRDAFSFCLRFWSLLLLVGIGPRLAAQTDHNAHLWLRGSIELQTSERWMIRHETYIRRSEWGKTWQQLVSRSAIQFRSPRSMLWSVGYAFHNRYPYGMYTPRYTHIEHQLMLMHLFAPRLFERVQPQLRTRFEYRWLERQRRVLGTQDSAPQIERYFWQFARIRFQLGLIYSLDEGRNWRLELFLEHFYNLDRPLYRQFIVQNRLTTGLTHRLAPSVTLSAWLLHQWINPTTPKDEQNHTLFLAVNWRIKAFRRPPPPPDAHGAEF